eukprot:2719705-Rhodomonas_salina.1
MTSDDTNNEDAQFVVQLDLADEEANEHTEMSEVLTRSRAARRNMETELSMAQRERTDRQYMRDGMTIPDKMARTDHITALPDGPQIDHRAGQRVAEEFIRSQVGGDKGVGGDQGVGGAARDGGVELGGES